eukprot:7850541-Pyramimonas_sp.AAC.1
MLCPVVFVEGARRDTQDSPGSSGQLGVWRPRYVGWGWPGARRDTQDQRDNLGSGGRGNYAGWVGLVRELVFEI